MFAFIRSEALQLVLPSNIRLYLGLGCGLKGSLREDLLDAVVDEASMSAPFEEKRTSYHTFILEV